MTRSLYKQRMRHCRFTCHNKPCSFVNKINKSSRVSTRKLTFDNPTIRGVMDGKP